MEKFYSLSRAQKAIYKVDKLVGGSTCNICKSILFNKKYPVDEIKHGIINVFRINDALRIRIKDENGEPMQYFTEIYPNDIEVLYFKNKEELDAFGDKWAKEPINISGTLCEMKAVVLPDRSGGICKMHHVIGDIWSIALMGIQLSKMLAGKPFETYSFFDYLKKLEEYNRSKRHELDKAYYEEQFMKLGENIYFSDKHPSSFVAKRKTFEIGQETIDTLSKYAENNEATLFDIFVLTYSIYLSRIKMNAEKFNIGIALLNRSGAVERNTVGNFVNSVPFLVELENNKTFSENLTSIKTTVFKMFRHQKYCSDELAENLKSKYNFSGKFYDVLFSYVNVIFDDSIETTSYFQGEFHENLIINMDHLHVVGKSNVYYHYITEIFSESDINKIHYAMLSIIDDAIKNPWKKIRELKIAPKEELSILQGDTANLPESAMIPSLFEETVSKKGDETCIVTDDKNYTFTKFNNLVKLIDLEIRKITHGKKRTIAVAAERSIEMYASIYAIVRGGNSYLPIDPAYPEGRIEYMLENSGTKLVLAQDKFCDLFNKIKVLNVSETIRSGALPTENLPVLALPEDTAYIIYTSGSTGRPKGVKVSHRSLLNRILWMEKSYPLDENSVILQKTPYTFDVSLWEIFWWGISGGKMAFMKSGEHFLPEKIVEAVKRQGVTTIHFVPSVFDLFVSRLENNPSEREKVAALKDVFVSGEVLSASLINRFYAMFTAEKVKIHNLYGPTECAVDVTSYDCKARESDPVPIGKPIANTDIFILDNNMQAVPKGVIGEIFITGTNVGEGYVNNEELTKEVFLKNPFGEGKIYKTGDLGYINSENEIIFSGRKDSQIKLNGQRVELSEIENAISEIEGITLAAVAARKNSEGSQILCAFYTGESKESGEIRQKLGSSLPGYMIPQVITHLEEMPLTSSGKIDRLSLPEIDLEHVVLEKEFIEAKNQTERMVCDKFSEILHISPVSMNTDFFFSGGSSIDVLAFLSDERFRSISAPEFIANPTPAGICAALKNEKTNKYEYLQPLFVPEEFERAIVLFPYAGGNAESYSELVREIRKLLPDTAVYFIRFLHSVEECRAASEEVTDLKKICRIYFYAHCVGDSVALQIADFIEENQTTIDGLIVGANIPAEKPPKYNRWHLVPDAVMKKMLIRAGSRIGNLNNARTAAILRRFRDDSDFATFYFKSNPGKISSQITVIISKNDIFTPDFEDAEKNWQKYTHNKVNVRYIESDSHYFQAENADVLAEMIAETIKL